VTDKVDYEPSIAIFCDYENVAIGAQDANHDSFDIQLVLQRLLDKGKIVVKKAYSNWDKYKSARRILHESGFELIEVPHVSYSGKNSADIRLVVDALDLCYTKSHVSIFVIVSGDSDFSPLVGKLRENNKRVIGVGVKNSSSDLLVTNCDEFLYYDDLILGRKQIVRKTNERESIHKTERGSDKNKENKSSAAKAQKLASTNPKKKSVDETGEDSDDSSRKEEALQLVLDIVDRLFLERDDNLWGSMVKQTLKRKRPNFSETFHGYRSFNQLLEDAKERGLLEIEKDSKSGGYIILGFGPKA